MWNVDPSKIEAVKNWKPSKTPTEIHLFLGLARYYRQFIPNFSKIAKPLTLMTQKEKKFEWGKATMVADALSRKEWMKPRRVRAMSMTIHSIIKARILEAHSEASKDINTPAEMLRGLDKQFERKDNGGLYFMERIWVPSYGNLRTLIMDEAHATKYSVHPRADKILKAKAEHQKPSGLLQQPEIPEWKWEKITMDFITRLPRTSSGHDAIWVIADRLTKSAHFLVILEDYKMERLARLYINEIVARHGVPVSIISDCDSRFISRFWQSVQKALGTQLDMSTAYHPQSVEVVASKLIRPEIVQETTDKIVQIKDKLNVARDCQESYADNRQKSLEFSVGDKVLLKVSPWKGVVHFGKRSKLSPRYVRPLEIVERVSLVAYQLCLPQELVGIHDTFHVSNLKECLIDVNLRVSLVEIKIDNGLRFIEEPIKVMD
ncbi:putative reverse transcriptase domain-containing protein [Tanacetum coccineum]